MQIDNKQNRLRYINTAIYYWESKQKGVLFWWDKNKYTNEFINSQIIFFNKMKHNL